MQSSIRININGQLVLVILKFS